MQGDQVKRLVTIQHYGGGVKDTLEGELFGEDKPKTAKVHVYFGLGEWLIFNAMTGLSHGQPRGQWKLSELDRQAFCDFMGVKPKRRTLAPLRGRKPKAAKVDPRQLPLVTR
jgi:hypothetical protein